MIVLLIVFIIIAVFTWYVEKRAKRDPNYRPRGNMRGNKYD